MKDVNSMKKEEVIVTEFVPCNADIGHIIVKETECEPVLTIWTMIRQYRKRGQINTFVKSPLSFCYDPWEFYFQTDVCDFPGQRPEQACSHNNTGSKGIFDRSSGNFFWNGKHSGIHIQSIYIWTRHQL